MKRKILSLAVAAAAGTLAVNANATTFTNQGAVLGYGSAGNNHTLFANFKNPAFLASDDTSRKIGLGFSLGVDAELYGTAGVDDNFEALQKKIEDITGTVPDAEKEATAAFNDFLGKNGKLNLAAKASGSVPLVYQTTNYGGFMLAVSRTMGASGKMIGDEKADIKADGGTINDLQNLKLKGTNRALAFTSFQMTEFSAAYSTDLNRFFQPNNGQINAGVRLKMMNGGFNRTAMGFDSMITNRDDLNDQISDQISDMDSFNTETKLGVDLGVQYIAKNYLVGLSLENINSPSFKYTDRIGKNSDASFDKYMAKEIKFEPKARLEGALYTKNRHWTLAAFADLNETKDITGLDTQQAGVAASYASSKWYMPEVRVGYTHEAAGNEMSRIHAGLTAGFFNLDVAMHSTDFDKNKENSAAINMSFEFSF